MNDIALKAFSFAEKKHINQNDDSGFPYINHPIAVAEILRQITDDQNVIAAAYLHDTIEDTDTTYDELVAEFGTDIADLVNEVTHEGKDDHIGFYFPRLKTQRGILIKFADRMHNLSRMQPWSESRQQHYLKKSKFWKSSPEDK